MLLEVITERKYNNLQDSVQNLSDRNASKPINVKQQTKHQNKYSISKDMLFDALSLYYPC